MAQNKKKSRKPYIWLAVGLYYRISRTLNDIPAIEPYADEVTIALLLIIGIGFYFYANKSSTALFRSQYIKKSNKTSSLQNKKVNDTLKYIKTDTQKQIQSSEENVYNPYSLDGK